MAFEAILIKPHVLPEYFNLGNKDRGKAYPMQNVIKDRSFAHDGLMIGDIKLNDGTTYRISGLPKADDGYAFIVKRVYVTDPEEKDAVLQTWGDYGCDSGVDPFKKKDNRLFNWLMEYCRDWILARNSSLEDNPSFKFAWRLRCFQPFRSEKFKGKITITQSLKDFDTDKTVAMKITRAFGLMFPELTHEQLISMHDAYLRDFQLRDFTVHEGTSKDDFTLAYSGDQAPQENVNTTYMYKAMSHSCMRYSTDPKPDENYVFKDFPDHPCAVYASGDFKIIYTTDVDGKIGSRCVVHVSTEGKWNCGPIYGVSEQAMRMVKHYVVEQSEERYAFCESGSWDGARLLRIEYDGGFIGPYLDVCPQALTDDDKFLVINGSGEIDASQYQGVLSEYGCTCHCCGERTCEDDMRYSEHTGYEYCNECFYEDHFYCEHINEDCHDSEGVEVYYESSWGTSTERYHESIVSDGEAVECINGEVWIMEDTHYCEFEDSYVPPTLMCDYFFSDGDGELYPNDEHAECKDGSETIAMSIDEAKDLGYKLNVQENIWNKGEEE